jgi:hypothetical protein
VTRRAWAFQGPQRHWVPWTLMRECVNARGRHASEIRRVFALGPFTVYVMRYAPGNVPEKPERTP